MCIVALYPFLFIFLGCVCFLFFFGGWGVGGWGWGVGGWGVGWGVGGGGVGWGGGLSFRLYHHNTTALLHQANYSICFVFSESRVATIPSHTVSCFCCGFTPVDSVHTLPSRVIPIALGIIWPKDYLNFPKNDLHILWATLTCQHLA